MKEELGNIKLQRQHETNQHLNDIILKNNEQITSLVDVVKNQTKNKSNERGMVGEQYFLNVVS